MQTDLEGNEVIENCLPGVGTRLIINGNVFRIVYTKPGARPFRFTAEYVKRHEPKKPSSAADREFD